MNVNDSDLPDSVPPAEGAPAADAEAKPKRRRAPRKTAAAADDAGAPAPAAESAPAPAPAPTAAPTAAPVEASAPRETAATETAEGGEPAGNGGEGGEGGEAGEGDGKRRRNRNRRRGRRGDRERAPGEGGDAAAADDGADDADSDADDGPAAEPVPTAPPSPKDANELFSEVLSGQYDAEPVVEAPAEEDTKRVLAPDPDAPKLHKVLAQSGIGSRRDMEELIAEGRITVNGEAAHTGQRISFGDQIRIDNKPVKVRIQPPLPRVIAYHKPVGEVVTRDDPEGRPTVFRRMPRLQHGKWQSVGRLDINTEGLLLFTNSGDLANQLMHPRFGVEREYAVRVLGSLVEEQREELLEGVEIDGQRAAFRAIEDGGGEGVNRWYRVTITEGRNREVRKLFEAVGLAVSRLIRIRYGCIVLPRGLKRGAWVDLAGDDVRSLRQMAGVGRNGQREERGERGERQGDRAENRQGDRRGPKGGGGGGQQAQQGRRDGGGGNNKPRDRNNNNGGDRGERNERREPRERREPGEGGPIPNPLQQTYDKRAIREARAPKREYSEDGPIPNPLEQTYDKRFVQKPRGFGGGGGGGGRKGGGGERQPDPMQTSLGYIGADAFHKKMIGGGGGGGGRRGGGGGGGGGRGRR